MKSSLIQTLTFHLMCANRPLSAQELAALLNVTPRSVRNYIRELNSGIEPLVLSSHTGYLWNNKSAKIFPYYSDEYQQPTTPKYRSIYILRKILFYRSITKQELIESLHISDSTCEGDLVRIKAKIKNYNLKLTTQKDCLYLQGMEFNRRRLSVHCILSSNGDNSPLFSYIRNIFEEWDMPFLKDQIISTMTNFGLELNGFALNNILIYIGVQLTMLSRGYSLTDKDIPHLLIQEYPDYQAADKIAEKIEERFSISLNQYEREYIALLLISKANMKPTDSYRSANFVSTEMSLLVSQILFRLSSQYEIPLMDQELITQLSLHLQRLSVRSCTGLHKSSEVLNSIKSTYPFLYNIALILCNQISHEYVLDLSQDEISYIVLHLGGHLTKISSSKRKIRCMVVCPHYDNIKNHLLASLSRYFGDTLDVNRVTGEMDVEEISPDTQLVISTFPLPGIPNNIVISPILQREDLDAIQVKISQVLNQMRNNEFCQLLMRFLNPAAFEMNIGFQNSEEAIHHICQKLQCMNIIDDIFEEKVYERENISPTGFENRIAIPHANDYFAKQSVVYLIINHDTMDWGGNPVNLIFLVALSEKDQKDFYRLYNNLSLIFTNTDSHQAMQEINCFQDVIPAFMNILLT